MSKYSELCELRRAVENFCYGLIPHDKNLSILSKAERKVYSNAIDLLDDLDNALEPYDDIVLNQSEGFVHHCLQCAMSGTQLSPEESDMFFECYPRMYLSEADYNLVLDMLKEEK